MIDVALLGTIRRWHIRDQVPLREIARRLGISRNTVRRYLRSETTEPSYADRRSPSAIDKYAFQLSGLLKTEADKSRKQRRTLKQLHEELRELGFEGSNDRVAAFARVWTAGQTDRVNSASKRTRIGLFQAVMADPRRYEKSLAFNELATNAIEMAQGDVKLTKDTEPKESNR